MKIGNVVSLFDGKSCGQIALNKLGISYNNYYASEIDTHAQFITNKNYPLTKQIGDVKKVSHVGAPKIDLLLGGSPCQGFSIAGNQLNFQDPRSKLFFEYVRLLKALKPTYFLLENVNMRKEWRDIISKHVGVEPININGNLVSAAKRNRWYWTNIPNVIQPLDKGITFDDINSNNQDWLPKERIDRIRAWKAQQKPLENATLIGSGGKLPCLTARGYNQYHSGMILITNGSKYRYLTNNEAELAHNLPINYTEGVSDRERSRLIGNGWTIDVITHILKNIK